MSNIMTLPSLLCGCVEEKLFIIISNWTADIKPVKTAAVID